MLRKLLLLISFIFVITSANAQQTYKTALGVRINGGGGITLKHMLNERDGFEGILYTRWRGVNITGLYVVHYPVFTEPGFRFYMGAGAHIGFWDGNRNPWWDDDDRSHTVVGVDGQIGLEYTFDKIPLNLSLDWKPAINLIGRTNFWGSDAALSVRYTWK